MQKLLLALALAFPSLASAITVDEMLDHVDKNLTYDSRESSVRMTVVKSGTTKSYLMHSFGRGAEEMAMEYLEPARDKGTKMLKKNDELWMWLPSVEKTQKISGHMLRQGMMGSDMSYEDLMEQSTWRDAYTGTVVGEETLDGRKVWKVDLKAKDTTVSYPRRLIWVDQASYIPLKQELYALSGMLLKTWTMSDIRTVGDRQFAYKMVVEDKVQKNSRTEITFESVAFAVPLEEEVFSTRWLER
ncbi:MAG: outer membrane lipoprotein-sorting protein [Deltaproteobacteria bacterium]|nr:outer membrane lipoprotein-sorting protein [Deltaproteobacteria bacterium]